MPDRARGETLVAEASDQLDPAVRPLVLRLARAVSLAVMVEPGLLRRARQTLVPGADAGVESDLWFSPLVITRNTAGAVLDPDAAAVLRGQLAAGVEGEDFAAGARRLVAEAHGELPPMMRLEEELIWDAVRGDAGAVEAGLRRAVASMVTAPTDDRADDGGRAVARWASQALGRLPEAVTATEAARLLAVGACLRVRNPGAVSRIGADELPGQLGWLAPGDATETVAVGVELADGGLRFVEPDAEGLVVDVPRSSPPVVEVAWGAGEAEQRRLAAAVPGTVVALEAAAGDVRLRTLTGRSYVLEPELAPGGATPMPAAEGTDAARLREACVAVVTRDGEFTGYFVEDDMIATVAVSRMSLDDHPVRWRGVTLAAGREGAAAEDEIGLLLLGIAQPTAAPLPSSGPALHPGARWSTFDGVTGEVHTAVYEKEFRLPGALRATLAGAPILSDGRLAGHIAAVSEGQLIVVPPDAVRRSLERRPDFGLALGVQAGPWERWVVSQLVNAGYRFEAGQQPWESEARPRRRLIVLTSPGATEHAPSGPERRLRIAVGGADAQRADVDLTELDEATAREALLRTARAELGEPSHAPGAQEPASPFPAARARVSNLPEAPGAFVARGELELVLAGLRRGEPIAVIAPPGAGKTRLAVEAAHRLAQDCDIVWWVRAGNDDTRLEDFAALAVALELDVPDPSQAIPAVFASLTAHDRWLLVLDDAPSPAEIAGALPQKKGPQVLITSSWSPWPYPVSQVNLPPLSYEDATRLLEVVSGRSRDEDGALEQVADLLGGMPLALRITAADVAARSETFASYRDRFDRASAGHAEPPLTTSVSLAKQVVEALPAAALILDTCAVLADAPVPKSVFADAPEATFDRLAELALVWKADESIAMHPLVSQLLRDGMTLDARRSAVARTQELLLRAMERSGPDVLARHALALADRAEEVGATDAGTVTLMHEAAGALQAHGDLVRARDLLVRATKLAQAVHLEPRIEARVRTSLGEVHFALAQWDEAEASFRGALQLHRSASAEPTGDEAAPLLGLGQLMRALGRTEESEKLLRQALAVTEQHVGSSHPNAALVLNALGTVRLDTGRLDEAVEAFERALRIHEESGNVLAGSAAMNNLGVAWHMRGDLDAARHVIERALALDEQAYGPDHPGVASALGNLSGVLADMGELESALDTSRRALAIREAVFGPDNPETARSLELLGSVLVRAGDLSAGRDALDRALHIYERVLGPDDPRTIRARRAVEPSPQ